MSVCELILMKCDRNVIQSAIKAKYMSDIWLGSVTFKKNALYNFLLPSFYSTGRRVKKYLISSQRTSLIGEQKTQASMKCPLTSPSLIKDVRNDKTKL